MKGAVLSSREVTDIIADLVAQGADVSLVTGLRYKVKYSGHMVSISLGTSDHQQLKGAAGKIRRIGLHWPQDPREAPRPTKGTSTAADVSPAAVEAARQRALAAEERLRAAAVGPTGTENHMGITSKIEQITPALAAKYLESNTKNRKLSDALVARLARMMLEHKWQFDGSPIRFDKLGDLVDGQHRLWAIVESDTTQEFLVVRGVEPEAMATMDTGKSRSFADILSMNHKDVPNVIATAAATSLIYRWEQGLRGGLLRAANAGYVPYSDLLRFFEGSKDRLIDVSRSGKVDAYRTGVAGSVFALAHWVLEAIDSEDADEFFDRLKDGVGLGEYSPILLLRNWLGRTYTMRPRPNPEMQAALIFKAWNAYRDGEPMKQLGWRRGGANPEPFPEPR